MKPNAPNATGDQKSARTFADERAFLEKFGAIQVLEGANGARVALSAKWQGRVMTSAIADDAPSLGFVHRGFIESNKHGTPFDNYGGEDRFWLGPEGGQFSIFFAPQKPFTFAEWQTPAPLNEGEWAISEQSKTKVVFATKMSLVNWSKSAFEVGVRRAVTLLSDAEVAQKLGVAIPEGVRTVAFETDNQITNAGKNAWTKESGLVGVWILGMYNPSKDTHVVVPFDPKGQGPIVKDDYFGKVPAERLIVKDDHLIFTCDGEHRSKIGLRPSRARAVLGSYSASSRLLTIVQYDKPAGASEYVNGMWAMQTEPYAGDVVNSYNDGPTEPGKPSLGGFYEMETSSPAAALGPGASLAHAHRTFHFVGDRPALEAIAKKVLGVSLP